ncbi:MAG: HAD-IB family phosphatase, partial [Hyphomonadaceae bacterium]
MHVFCDFDGTIAQCDVTDLALQAFAAPEWEDLERAWLAGQMDAAACMRGQIALMEAPSALLDALLDSVEIDPGFADFVAWCEARAIPVTVVSDGVDYFIQRVLRRHGLARLPVSSHQLGR